MKHKKILFEIALLTMATIYAGQPLIITKKSYVEQKAYEKKNDEIY